MFQFENAYFVDLEKGPVVDQLRKPMHYGNDKANRIGATVTKNGQAITLSGNCTGKAILGDDTWVLISNGVIDGNEAYIELPSACYSVEGPIRIFVNIDSDDTELTLLDLTGYVKATQTDSAIDPEHPTFSVSELERIITTGAKDQMDAIEAKGAEVIASIPSDYTAVITAAESALDRAEDLFDAGREMIAPEETSSTASRAYAVGELFIYNDLLYRATAAIAQGGTITPGTNCESVPGGIGGEVGELKSALNDIETDIDDIYEGKLTEIVQTDNKLNPEEVERGKKLTQYGATTDGNGFTVTGFIPLDTTKSSIVFSGMNVAGTKRVGMNTSRICFYDTTKTFVSKADSILSNTVTAIPINAAYARIGNTNVYWERSPMVEFVDSISEISATYVEYEEITSGTHGINYLDEKQQEIDGRLSDAEDELTYLSELGSQVSSNTSRLDDITGASKYISELATFEHGYINSAGNYVSTYQYRIATPDYVNIDADINLVITDGFRVYLAYYDANNAVISVGWVTGALTIETGSKIRMTIARVTEDSSETADIAVFCSKVTYSLKESVSYLAGKVRDIDAQIPYGCTWDWWISANSIDKFGNAYIGYVDTDAYAGVIRRQPDGVMQYKRLEKSWNDDDHNGMATIVLDDGRVLVIGSHGHAQDNHIICYRSTEPYSIDSMEKLSFDIPETGGYKYRTTYSQIFKYNGKLFDFVRVSVQQGTTTITDGVGYLCFVSDDDGDTWTAYKAIQSSDPYISFANASDDAKIIKGVYTNNPGTRPVNMMKGFTFDMSTYEFANLSGTKIGELVLLDGGVIADENIAHYADMTDLVQRGETSRSCRLFYVCKTTKSTTAFLYAIADDSTNADWVYKLYLNGTSIDIGRSGVPFGSNTYISGACFGKDVNTVYYAKATTASADGNHELHKVTVSNGAVVSDEIITESSVCIVRPLFLGNGELATVVGHYNDQTSSGYNGSYTAWELKPLFTHA